MTWLPSAGVVFETSISFQLAFFSLIEHDTEIAALWDPSKVGLIGKHWRTPLTHLPTLTSMMANVCAQL